MKKVLGYIYSDNNLNTYPIGFKPINYIDNETPTIIIGYENINKLYPDFDITKFEIEKNIYWTFKKNEKRDKYDNDLTNFFFTVYKKSLDKIKYILLDPLQLDRKELYTYLEDILSRKNFISYKENDMVYMYNEYVIYGVDLKLLKFMSFNIENVLIKIKKNSKVLFEEKSNLDSHLYLLGFQQKFIPYLYYLKNE